MSTKTILTELRDFFVKELRWVEVSDIEKFRAMLNKCEEAIAEIIDPIASGEQKGRCCYGGLKYRSECASCAAWQPVVQPIGEAVAWIDAEGNLHKSPRFHFLGLVDETCGSRDYLWSGSSIEDAGRAWLELIARGARRVDLTGWGCGTLATSADMAWRFQEAKGTFACPICKVESPHHHGADEVEDHKYIESRRQEIRAEAWPEISNRIAALEKHYPERIPLYTHPITDGSGRENNKSIVDFIRNFTITGLDILSQTWSGKYKQGYVNGWNSCTAQLADTIATPPQSDAGE